MPQKNTLKEYAAESHYHIYTRGINKQQIFVDAGDYEYFEGLLERYLGPETIKSKTGEPYPNYRQQVALLTYCLMPNHIHLLVYQREESDAVSKFMRSLLTSYSKYFNLKYKRVGSVFESRYKGKRIDNDSYLIHIGRYIHMNPRYWQSWRHSGLRYVFADTVPAWLSLDGCLEGFKDKKEYLQFLKEYQQRKDELEVIKHELADR